MCRSKLLLFFFFFLIIQLGGRKAKRETRGLGGGGGNVNEAVLVKSLTHQMKQEYAAWKHAGLLEEQLAFPTYKCLRSYAHQRFHS